MKRASLRLLGLSCALMVALACAGAAQAEQAVIPTSASLPWSDPAHQTPLEQYATTYASLIAGRTARVQCHGANEWAALGFPADSLGVVRYLYDPYSMVIVATEDIVHLNESTCLGLQRFGEVAQKPTRCATSQTVATTVYGDVRVKKKVWYGVKVKMKYGKTKLVRKSRYVFVTKRVPRTVFEEVPGPSVPCYGSGQTLPTDYGAYAKSLQVLAHESIHVFDTRVGHRVQTQASAESRAECFGMQFLGPLAYAFGADEDDARALAKYYWDVVYPMWGSSSPYWRSDCHPDSALDLAPNDASWPRRATPRKVAPMDAPGVSLGPLVWATISD